MVRRSVLRSVGRLVAQGKCRKLRTRIFAWVKECGDDVVLEKLEEFLDAGAVYNLGDNGAARAFGKIVLALGNVFSLIAINIINYINKYLQHTKCKKVDVSPYLGVHNK